MLPLKVGLRFEKPGVQPYETWVLDLAVRNFLRSSLDLSLVQGGAWAYIRGGELAHLQLPVAALNKTKHINDFLK